MNIPNQIKLMAVSLSSKGAKELINETWNHAKAEAKKKNDNRTSDKFDELGILLDAYAAMTFALGMTCLANLEKDKVIVVSPSAMHEAAVKLGASPVGQLALLQVSEEILEFAKKNGMEVPV
jgi:hypothetical protein